MVPLSTVRYWTLQRHSIGLTIANCSAFLSIRGLPTVCIRLLANMYTNHVTRVAWNGVPSGRFSVKNGVQQGAVLSPVLFCLYLGGLLSLLATSGAGA